MVALVSILVNDDTEDFVGCGFTNNNAFEGDYIHTFGDIKSRICHLCSTMITCAHKWQINPTSRRHRTPAISEELQLVLCRGFSVISKHPSSWYGRRMVICEKWGMARLRHCFERLQQHLPEAEINCTINQSTSLVLSMTLVLSRIAIKVQFCKDTIFPFS